MERHHSRTALHVFDHDSVTGQVYKDVILQKYVRFFRGAMGAHFLFMDDNACPHRAALVDDYLETEDTTCLDWPANSPNLNPIEHAWDTLGIRIVGHQIPPRTIQELRVTSVQEWNSIPQVLLDNLVLSMGARCTACVAALGDHTSY